ncbi:MAG TPA: hypothetical protein VF054_07150 [Micromonosporaceae bacterium]
MNRPHPGWCGRGHHCTAEFGIGEHRSRPLTLPDAGGPVATVASLVLPVGQACPVLEVRLRVRLSPTTPIGQVRDLLNALESTLRKELGR